MIVISVTAGLISATMTLILAVMLNFAVISLLAVLAGWYDEEEYSCED